MGIRDLVDVLCNMGATPCAHLSDLLIFLGYAGTGNVGSREARRDAYRLPAKHAANICDSCTRCETSCTLMRKAIYMVVMAGVGLLLWAWWSAYRVVLVITETDVPQPLVVCQQEDTQQFQRARQAGIITKTFRTAAGYLDQIAVMPTWYDMPSDLKRGLVKVASCALSSGKDGIQVFDAQNGAEIARWTTRMRDVYLIRNYPVRTL
jgi:hypothetical protein